MTRINLNERIKVRLTDLGKDIYYHQFDNLNERAGRCVLKPVYPKTDEDGYTEFQLWVFIELYGRHIGMAKPNVIYPNEIVCVEEPTTDAIPVVRCKDCKFYNPHIRECEGFGKWFGLENEWGDNDFCSHGERREDG